MVVFRFSCRLLCSPLSLFFSFCLLSAPLLDHVDGGGVATKTTVRTRGPLLSEHRTNQSNHPLTLLSVLPLLFFFSFDRLLVALFRVVFSFYPYSRLLDTPSVVRVLGFY